MGGGHKRNCYDCSGAVSYVLGPEGADILDSPLDSGSLRKWGERGRGSWITVYTNPGHAYVVIAGLRFDTSIPDDGAEGPGWSQGRQGRARQRPVPEAPLRRPLGRREPDRQRLQLIQEQRAGLGRLAGELDVGEAAQRLRRAAS